MTAQAASPDPVVPPRVVLLGKPGCHLCQEARRVVAEVCDPLGLAWEERDLTQDPELWARHAEEVPVLLVDGRVRAFHRVDPQRLRALLGDGR